MIFWWQLNQRRRTIPEIIKQGFQQIDVSQGISAEEMSSLFSEIPDLDLNKFKMQANGRYKVERDMQLRLRQFQKEQNLKSIQEQIDIVEAQIEIYEEMEKRKHKLSDDEKRQFDLHQKDLVTLKLIRQQYENISTIPSASIELEAKLNLDKTFSVIELQKLISERGLDLQQVLSNVIATPEGFKLDENFKTEVGQQIADGLKEALQFAQEQLSQAKIDFDQGIITQEQLDSYKSIAEQTEQDYEFTTKLNDELERRINLEESLKILKSSQEMLSAQPTSTLSKDQLNIIGVRESGHILALMDGLRRKNFAVLCISHNIL